MHRDYQTIIKHRSHTFVLVILVNASKQLDIFGKHYQKFPMMTLFFSRIKQSDRQRTCFSLLPQTKKTDDFFMKFFFV